MQDGPEVRSLAGIIAGSSMQGSHLHVPCSRSQQVDKARIKTKEVYEGIWKARLSTVKGCNKKLVAAYGFGLSDFHARVCL